MTDLIAQSPFFYDGRTRRKGERFKATPKHAEMLILAKRAICCDDEPEALPTVTKPRRAYRRRDMRAED